MLKLNLDDLRVDSFAAETERAAALPPTYHNTVLRHTEQISCYASDCGTCGGTDCWV